MKTDINNLLKKGKLTGQEVGQLMIQDLVATYKNYLEGKGDEGFLTQAETNTLVNGLTKSQDIKRYREFRGVHEYIVNAARAFVIHEEIMEEHLWKINYIFNEMRHAEEENFQAIRQPRIMTQKQYDELKREDFEEKMTWTYSFEMLLFDALEYYINLHNEGEKTPFDKHFAAAKKQPIKNPRIKADYYESESEDKTAADTATMFDVLEYAKGFYSSLETDSQKTLFEFTEDFPGLYKDLWSKLTAMKGLNFLKDIPKKKYFDDALISVRELYENNILNFRDFVGTFHPDGCGGGVAVLQSHCFYPRRNIDEHGYYRAPEPYWRKHFMAEAILSEPLRRTITRWIALFSEHLKECFVIRTAFLLIGEFTGVPQISTLIDGIDGEIDRLTKRGELVNQIIENAHDLILSRYGALSNERSVDELRSEFKNTFPLIDMKYLMPSEDAIEEARQTLDFTMIQNDAEQLYAILKNEEVENTESTLAC
ncbi:MAG TPA: hypothetical protein PLF77_04820 [Smithella sp.]|mgnify:CR=1 FL=1|jgi:hypothetical protein|nr:hypothetical protein [Smithella sp.]